ncbi:LRR receptor-like serine/threonine-protein kinase GSO2 [Papaver somniferum]|uniref:LRR receptor-like serine/threonine-protein kinase GSO2 n=1 Tax=Papaver somniferum TaxID=3469 RepID=UPI000E6F4D31|nr:LRR receptor-like serine/threonine-protein kinase GSO2 [Papaver somniferum]
MEGLFPTFICILSNLKNLDLSQNNLTGVIPSCVSNLKSLSNLDVSNNNFHGPLPLIPKNVLSFLDLSNNKLRGKNSIEMGKILSSIDTIVLSDNELSGPIPFSMCSKVNRIIDLSNNKLSGIIPTSIGYCTKLLSLNFGHNNLTGNVPDVLGQALSLTFLQLNDNNLDGVPLGFISKFQRLEVLNLAKNKFEGSIPTAFGSLEYLQILSLRFNKFNGSIPEEITHLQPLQILDISHNHLTGLIPKKIGNLTRLISRPEGTQPLLNYGAGDLKLQMVIKGIVTQLLKVFHYTSGVDLSCNTFSGNIPEEIGLLKALSTLNLSHNQLSGIIPQECRKYERIPKGLHFDTLSGDGSAYINNSLLCGDFTNNTCEGDKRSNSTDNNSPNEGYEDDQNDAKDKLLLYAIVALGFAVGFWGLFFVLLIKKEKWWFG